MPIYKMIAVDEIKTAHFNPVKRIERARLTGLLLSVREHGILEPLVLAHDLTLADGHRRLAVAKLLKLPEVPVAIYAENLLSAPALWVILNSDTMSLTPAQWLAAVDAGLPLDTPGFPTSLKSRVEMLQRLIGSEAIALLVEQGRSPLVLDMAYRVARYCDRRQDEGFVKIVLEWLLNSGNVFSARNAMMEEVPVDILVEAIEEGHELTRVWDIAR